jgi:hypothetical protein
VFTGAPFHSKAPAAVMTILFLIGSTGGGGEPSLCGRSSFTAWVWIGMVMMNMMRSTSRTSISGVVLMSMIGSPDELSLVVCIAMAACS